MSALTPFVATLSAYDLGGAVHRGLPSSTVSITIPEDAIDVAWLGRPGSRRRFRAVVAGLHMDAAELTQTESPRGVWLTLHPLGASALLGVPAAALAGHVADLADVSPALAALPERLAARRTWPERRAVVEEALAAALARHGDGAGRLRPMLDGLAGAARVQDAAERLGCSRRHLGAAVRAELGVTPKEYQRLLRFEAARRGLAAGGADLARVAAEAGFADQAHFTREWRAMSGCTPAAWLRAEGRSRTFKTPPPPEATIGP
ncbi:helix-turn-helix domain-containing protein [Actinomadura atramentaria]|uniref:helix-turn-helix domain-containing protein n=1 Tax=Actinomadura atramentaria TaxID=1990 RepID=UPI000370D784|nr:helix-turn-helix domain-containing protein [Actinomadura atramentaria]